ncbi:MAG: L-threonylcarbamoyladenylate synthase [Eubacteriales bacterium]|nr:L-threonylcarbamoyladenylate synthase [Eubacteriales bacterium]
MYVHRGDEKLHTEYIDLGGVSPEECARALKKAGQIIRDGGLVAFPTETVYGLGADGMNEEACAHIYEAKGRPSDNPLILHIVDFEQVDEIAKDISEDARKIMETFWPGPLTVVLHKKDIVPDRTTGGLATVAVRMPSHEDARAFIRESGRIIAAPSANTSGKPSPTLGQHVYEDMNGRIPMILDGGAVGIGIESTIVDMTGDCPMILRPGFISRQDIEEVLGQAEVDPAITGRTMKKDVIARAPGMKYRHYAPKGQMILVEGEKEAVVATINQLSKEKEEEGCKVGIIATDETLTLYPDGIAITIGSREHPETVAANLYRVLRDMDEWGAEYIYSESFFQENMGDAIMNRMLKAAGYQVLEAGKE